MGAVSVAQLRKQAVLSEQTAPPLFLVEFRLNLSAVQSQLVLGIEASRHSFRQPRSELDVFSCG